MPDNATLRALHTASSRAPESINPPSQQHRNAAAFLCPAPTRRQAARDPLITDPRGKAKDDEIVLL